MKWPWVSRARLESANEQIIDRDQRLAFLAEQRIRDIASANGQSSKLVELLEKELSFYRAKYDAEKERADRAVDALVELSGREPLSAPVRQERVAEKDAAKSMMEQAQEVFAEVGESVMRSSDTEEDAPEPEPKEVPVAERLAAIASRLREKTASA